MECPHLANGIKIDRDFIKTKKLDLSSFAEGSTGSAGAAVSNTTSSKQWRCSGKHFPSHSSTVYCIVIVNGFECRVIFLSSKPDQEPVFMLPLTNKYKIKVLCVDVIIETSSNQPSHRWQQKKIDTWTFIGFFCCHFMFDARFDEVVHK